MSATRNTLSEIAVRFKIAFIAAVGGGGSAMLLALYNAAITHNVAMLDAFSTLLEHKLPFIVFVTAGAILGLQIARASIRRTPKE
jgi:hypothetical protein